MVSRPNFPILGIPEIDDQHRELVDAFVRFESWLKKGQGFSAALDAITMLQGYIERHLRYEEEMLRSRGYPKLDEHIRHHQIFMDKVDGFFQKLLDGEDVGAELCDFMRHWIAQHIGSEDVEYARFMGTRSDA
jgi:hemerythrin-like metal-binding protein